MAEYYVSTTGSSGNPGSQGSPWNLAHALSGAGGVIQPGDTIWMRGGVYTQGPSWVQSANGAIGSGVDNPDGKLKYRNFPGEKVSIENTNTGVVETLIIDGNYVWFWGSLGQGEGIEVYRNVTERATITRGGAQWTRASTDGAKLIHVICRDGETGPFNGNSAGTSYDQGDLELYNVISYNHGVDGAPRGHSFYLRHHGLVKKLRVTGCIGFNSLGHGLQLFGNAGNNGLQNIEAIGNILFHAGILGSVGSGSTWLNIAAGSGTSPFEGGKCNRNVMFQPGNTADEGNGYLGPSGATSKDLEVQDNYVVGGFNDHGIRVNSFLTDGSASLKFDRNVIIPRGAARPLRTQQAGVLSGYTSWTNNDYRRDPTATGWSHAGVSKNFATWKTDTGLGASDTASASNPTVNAVFAQLIDKYNPGYALACFFNWESSATVGVDLSQCGLNVGDSYAIHNVQDIFGAPVLSGTYAGGLVQFPTTGKTPPTPIGTTPRTAPTTAPFFDVFFVKRTAIGGGGGGGGGNRKRISVIDNLVQIA